jgi:hypothetical protein
MADGADHVYWVEHQAAKIGRWVGVFANALPGQPLAAYFGAHKLRPAHLAAEQEYLQAGFRRRALAHRYAAARWVAAPGFSRPTALAQEAREQARAAVEQAAAEQARFDAQYQARQQQQADRAVAEAELEREAAKDAGWRRADKKRGERRHATDPTENAKAARASGYVHETFALAGQFICAELGRSELDLLGDLAVPIPGFRANAHARRRAFFSRIPASSRPVSLARAA